MDNVKPASAGSIPAVRNFDPVPTMGIRYYPQYGSIHAVYAQGPDENLVLVKHPEGVDSYSYFCAELSEPLAVNPWRIYPFFRDNVSRWIELLPRPSETKPGLVAYYQSPEKRLRNIQTPIKAGRFLQKFFGDILDQPAIQTFALMWETEFTVPEVTITQDADEIEDVYRNGPYSCMQSDFSSPKHPARVYAGPDLGVAYTGPRDEPTARVVVWPRKKLFVDCQYGDEPRIKAALEAIGYEEGSDSDFSGARIQRLPYHGQFIVPYSDTHDTAWDDDDYLILGHGDIELRNTNGLGGTAYRCDDCNESMSDDERTYIEDNGHDVCENCLNEHYFRCEGSEEYYRNNKLASTAGEEYYSLEHVRNNPQWFLCEYTDKYYHRDDFERVETIEDETVVLDYAEKNGFYCEHAEQWSLATAKEIRLTKGWSVHIDSFRTDEDFRKYLTDNETEQVFEPHPDQHKLPEVA